MASQRISTFLGKQKFEFDSFFTPILIFSGPQSIGALIGMLIAALLALQWLAYGT
jgi:hypothetical protein